MDGIEVNTAIIATDLCAVCSTHFRGILMLTFLKIIDTGTTLIYLPEDVVREFYGMVRSIGLPSTHV